MIEKKGKWERIVRNIDCKLNELDGKWELILIRLLDHPRMDVWHALTRAEELVEWGPFMPDRNLTEVGPVRLMHMNNPQEDVRQGFVLEVKPPSLLVFQWGNDMLRWELKEVDKGTELTLRHRFSDRIMAPSYAAGWHLCLRGLTGTLAGVAMPSMVGSEAIKHGYKELYKKYETLFDKSNSMEGLI